MKENSNNEIIEQTIQDIEKIAFEELKEKIEARLKKASTIHEDFIDNAMKHLENLKEEKFSKLIELTAKTYNELLGEIKTSLKKKSKKEFEERINKKTDIMNKKTDIMNEKKNEMPVLINIDIEKLQNDFRHTSLANIKKIMCDILSREDMQKDEILKLLIEENAKTFVKSIAEKELERLLNNEFENLKLSFSVLGANKKINGRNHVKFLGNKDEKKKILSDVLIQSFKEETKEEIIDNLTNIQGKNIFTYFSCFLIQFIQWRDDINGKDCYEKYNTEKSFWVGYDKAKRNNKVYEFVSSYQGAVNNNKVCEWLKQQGDVFLEEENWVNFANKKMMLTKI